MTGKPLLTFSFVSSLALDTPRSRVVIRPVMARDLNSPTGSQETRDKVQDLDVIVLVLLGPLFFNNLSFFV